MYSQFMMHGQKHVKLHGYMFVVSVVLCQVEVFGQADHSFRAVLSNVTCLHVISKPQQ